MRLQLTPSYYLTDETDTPSLVHRQSGRQYSPEDVLQLYPSWDMQPARQSVRRAIRTLQLNAEERDLVSVFVGPGRPTIDPATGHIHLRVSMDRKNAYVRAAQTKSQTLAAWMFGCCDKESGHNESNTR